MISDLEIARLCSAIYTDTSVFDHIDDGSKTGIFFGVKKCIDMDWVIFRGSFDTEDWVHDFEALPVFEYNLGYVHSGFNRNLAMVHQALDGLVRPHPGLGGHSKGAGHASILAGEMTVANNAPSRVVLFGCPRPGYQSLCSATKDLSINSYRNRTDPVPTVPLTTTDFPYTDLRPFIPLDGHAENPFDPLLKDHHINCYVNGMEILNAKSSPSQ